MGRCIKRTVGMLDSLFDYPFPYMMCLHQDPVNNEDTKDYYHFHIEFFPPMRSKEKIKFNASSETELGHTAILRHRRKAAELREAYAKFMKTQKEEG